MKTIKTSLALAFGIALSACGGNVDIPAEASGSVSGAGGASTTVSATSTSTTSTAISTTGVGGGPAYCGPNLGIECDPNTEFCDFGAHDCGGNDGNGICTPKPLDCGGTAPMPVCGCDGMTYPSACLANLAGSDVDVLGGCAAPVNTFACGSGFCATGTQYCLHDIESNGAECATLPPVCQAPNATCACLLQTLSCSSCMDSAGQIFATCGEG